MKRVVKITFDPFYLITDSKKKKNPNWNIKSNGRRKKDN